MYIFSFFFGKRIGLGFLVLGILVIINSDRVFYLEKAFGMVGIYVIIIIIIIIITSRCNIQKDKTYAVG